MAYHPDFHPFQVAFIEDQKRSRGSKYFYTLSNSMTTKKSSLQRAEHLIIKDKLKKFLQMLIDKHAPKTK